MLKPTSAAMSQPSKIAERLLAHARLCRQIARESWNEETACKLAEMADECTRAAENCDAIGPAASRLH